MPFLKFLFFNDLVHLLAVVFLVMLFCTSSTWNWRLWRRGIWNNAIFRDVADRSFDVIFLTDKEGNLIYLSPSAEKTFARRDSDTLGKNIGTFIESPSKEKVAQLFKRVLEKGHLEGVELSVRRGDNTLVDIEVNAAATIRRGKSQGIQGVMRDITERKRMEQKLRERNEELRRINELMTGREMKIIELKKELQKMKEMMLK